MTENHPAPAALPAKSVHRWNLIQRVADNPVILKELRGRMRGRPAFILMTGYLALISLVIGIMYVTLARETPYSIWNPEFRQGVGKAIFSTVVIMELFLVSLIGPALTSGAITSERERQTFDILRTTTLSARAFVLGKLGSSLAFLLLLIFTALPIESIAFLLGGVGLEEILVSSLLLVITAVFYCSLGLFFSSFMRRTAGASVSSYVFIVLSYVLLGVIFFITAMAEVSSYAYSSYQANNPFGDILLSILLWLLISTNPLLTAVMSEVILVEDQSLFFTSQSFFGTHNLILPSPWILYTLIYVFLTFILVTLSIRFVRRPDR